MDKKVVLTAAIVVAFLLSSSILVLFYNQEAEDNEINLEISTELLSGAGVEVIQAWNGREALDAFDASSLGLENLTEITVSENNDSYTVANGVALLKDGVLLANAGHFDVEVYVPDLKEMAKEVRQSRDNIDTYVMDDGRRLHLLGEGRLVNLAAGDGHPVEIMDLSFAMQLLSALYISTHKLEPGLYNVPEELDRRIAELKLESLGITIEKLTPEQEEYMASWRE